MAFKAESGAGAVQGAQTTRNLQGSETYQTDTERVKTIGIKTFYLKNGTWVDNEFSSQGECFD
ncbi:MAG TPA: hypothetical protein EYP86_02090 [Candidatus Altiarchaeales archaeon]|nr:hypothetical protein [Candidatus Altiarchaeales archaeon]